MFLCRRRLVPAHRIARRIYFPLLIFALSVPLIAETVAVPSSVTSVTVYSDRALVTRTGEITLQPGNYLLRFNNLPASLLDQSVRVSGEAAGAKILDVHVETAFLDTVPEERVRTLQAKVQELQTQSNELGDRLSVLNTERDFILQIKAQTADNIDKDLKVQRPTTEDWQKVLAFFDSNLNRIFAEQRKVAKDRTDLQGKIETLQKQINQISPRARKSVKNIAVEVQITKGGEVRLFPSYVVSGARWYPQYDVRVSTESQDVELNYYGFIQQNTGEDWTDADISLSTARPDVGGEKPELGPWYLNIFQPLPQLQKSRMGAAVSEIVAAQGAEKKDAASELEAVGTPEAEVETQPTSALFHITSRSTVPSDNTAHRTTIAIEKMHAEFFYSSTPKLSPYVYRKAAIKNTSQAPFLAGNANVFSNDDFIANSAMKTTLPDQSFDVYLGVDPAVRIERKLVNRFTDYTGTFTKNVRVTYEFSFTLENTKKSGLNVAVQDQLPVSQNEKITVEQVEPAEKELRRDDQGFLNWNVILNPGEKKNWKLKFNIEYPQGTTISGLE